MSHVSVIVPFLNAAPYLECCVRSVLSQTINDWELLLVNDGSTDGSLRIAQDFASLDTRIHVLQHANGVNLGVSKSRQLGIDNAAGDFIALLDADDLFHKLKLENQLQNAELMPQCGVFHTAVQTIDKDGLSIQGTNPFNDFSKDSKEYEFGNEYGFLQSHAVCNSSTMIRKSCLQGLVIGYSQFFQIEDFVLWTRLSERTLFYFDSRPMVSYREHSNNATYKMSQNSVSCNLVAVEFLSAVIATCRDKKNVRLARQRREETLMEMERRVRSETCVDPIKPESRIGDYRLRILGLARRIRRAIRVLFHG